MFKTTVRDNLSAQSTLPLLDKFFDVFDSDKARTLNRKSLKTA